MKEVEHILWTIGLLPVSSHTIQILHAKNQRSIHYIIQLWSLLQQKWRDRGLGLDIARLFNGRPKIRTVWSFYCRFCRFLKCHSEYLSTHHFLLFYYPFCCVKFVNSMSKILKVTTNWKEKPALYVSHDSLNKEAKKSGGPTLIHTNIFPQIYKHCKNIK